MLSSQGSRYMVIAASSIGLIRLSLPLVPRLPPRFGLTARRQVLRSVKAFPSAPFSTSRLTMADENAEVKMLKDEVTGEMVSKT